ncbi:MAG: hypothetical protein JWO94_786 [Verrucomicrobiaceae bacterium]|nr:hypothetical protein [Verrucomicrobiaceae bacterium]
MKTAPSFQFYPSDFLGGTVHLSAEEVGALIRLLCHQWHQGSIPGDPRKIERIAGVKHAKLAEVLVKFRPRPDGSLVNRRMEDTRKKIEGFRQKQSENGRKGGRPVKPRPNPPVPPGLAKTEPKQSSHTQFQSHSQSHAQFQSQDQSQDHHSSADAEPPIPPEGGFYWDDEAGFVSPAARTPHKHWDPTDEQLAVGSWFHRRLDTVWTDRELTAWRALGPLYPDDLATLRIYYQATLPQGKDFRRRDLFTLLTNWSGELDRARKFQPSPVDDPNVAF